jgi:hypothetical protein
MTDDSLESVEAIGDYWEQPGPRFDSGLKMGDEARRQLGSLLANIEGHSSEPLTQESINAALALVAMVIPWLMERGFLRFPGTRYDLDPVGFLFEWHRFLTGVLPFVADGHTPADDMIRAHAGTRH